MKKRVVLSFIFWGLLLSGLVGCYWDSSSAYLLMEPNRVQLLSKHAILIDLFSDQVLFEKEADTVIPPASMTKLVTIWVALNAVQNQECNLEDSIRISWSADYHNQPPHSSLMFLEQGQRATLKELLVGLAVPSGNDAAIAVAQVVAGSQKEFVVRMNQLVEKLGLTQTRFVDPSGYSSQNQTTPREFALLASQLWRTHPKEIEEICSTPAFAYPQSRHLRYGGKASLGQITQTNHNELVGRLYGVVGMKTGFIDASGMNVTLAAQRGETRLLAVLMGGEKPTTTEGQLNRAVDGTQLLTWGFENFVTVQLKPTSDQLQFWNYKLVTRPSTTMTLSREELNQIKIRCRINLFKFLLKKEGAVIGSWHARKGLKLRAKGELLKGTKNNS